VLSVHLLMPETLLSVVLVAAVPMAVAVPMAATEPIASVPEARPAWVAPHWQAYQDLWVNTTSWVQQVDGIWFAETRTEPRPEPEPARVKPSAAQALAPVVMPTVRLQDDPPLDLLAASGALTAAELQRVKAGGGLRPLSLAPDSLRLACSEAALPARDCQESMILRDPRQNQRPDDSFAAERIAVNCITKTVSRKPALGWWSSWQTPQPDSAEALLIESRCQPGSS
jgi:hypothetical protein